MGTSQQGGFQGCCTGGNHTRIRRRNHVVRIALHDGNREGKGPMDLLEVGLVNGGSFQQGHLPAIGPQNLGCRQHRRQKKPNFRAPAARHQDQQRLLI
jgi:hypothetical protein